MGYFLYTWCPGCHPTRRGVTSCGRIPTSPLRNPPLFSAAGNQEDCGEGSLCSEAVNDGFRLTRFSSGRGVRTGS